MVYQKATTLLLMLAVVNGQTPSSSPTPFDDDGFEQGYLCYYDDTCLFACAEVDKPEDCLNYVFTGPSPFPLRRLREGGRQLQQPNIPLDIPYVRSNADGSSCEPTSDGKLALGKIGCSDLLAS